MKKFIAITALALFLALPAMAANEFTADGNIIVSSVAGGITKDLLIMNGANAEEWNYSASGVFTVKNPGTFKIGSADGDVKSILIKNSGGTTIACANNSSAGSSYVTLPTTTATYIVEPSSVDCTTLCTVITGIGSYYNVDGTYNIPSCGAATCSGSYTLSEASGSTTASCNAPAAIITGGGGGGGGGPTYPETAYTDPEGTQVTTKIKDETMEANIKPAATTTRDQIITMDTAFTAIIEQIRVGLTNAMIKKLSAELSPGQSIRVTIKPHDATAEQKTNEARAGMYMIGFDVFTVEIYIGDKLINILEEPIFLTFDVSGLPQPENLRAYYYNETKKLWEQIGEGGEIINGELTISLEHLTSFTLMKEISKTTPKEIASNAAIQWQNILGEAAVVFKGGVNLDELLNHNQTAKNITAQSAAMKKYTDIIVKNFSSTTASEKYAINNFIVYGTKNSQKLGAGERAGIINSFKAAFGKLPTTEKDWVDVLAIGSGRWPSQSNKTAENKAKIEFKKVYKRDASMLNANDNAAVTIMAYGLRNAVRNTNSENSSIKTFKAIYKKGPATANDWDIVRAIAYSGAKR